LWVIAAVLVIRDRAALPGPAPSRPGVDRARVPRGPRRLLDRARSVLSGGLRSRWSCRSLRAGGSRRATAAPVTDPAVPARSNLQRRPLRRRRRRPPRRCRQALASRAVVVSRSRSPSQATRTSTVSSARSSKPIRTACSRRSRRCCRAQISPWSISSPRSPSAASRCRGRILERSDLRGLRCRTCLERGRLARERVDALARFACLHIPTADLAEAGTDRDRLSQARSPVLGAPTRTSAEGRSGRSLESPPVLDTASQPELADQDRESWAVRF
jgi:hypothetical protein